MVIFMGGLGETEEGTPGHSIYPTSGGGGRRIFLHGARISRSIDPTRADAVDYGDERSMIMPEITLTEEQARIILSTTEPVVVRDPQGRTVANFTLLSAVDIEMIERAKR